MHVRHCGATATDLVDKHNAFRFGRAGVWFISHLLMAIILCASGATLAAEDDDELPDEDSSQTPFHMQPDDEFVIPEGDIRPGAGRHVLLNDSSGKPVVGRIHVEGDNRYLVLMPDGVIQSVSKEEAVITNRPFKVRSRDEIQESLVNGPFEGFEVKRTKNFLYLYTCSKPFSKATSTILETMYPKLRNFCENLDLDIHDPEFPLVVIMFGDRESFDEYKQMPRGVAAYYSMISNHIVMYEDPELTEISPQLALKQSVSTIAHEGVHQILYNIGVQQRFSRWPMWIGEGLPEYCSPTETGQRAKWRGLGLVNNLRMHSLLQYRDYKKGKPDWFALKGVVEAKGLTALGYAHAWGIVYGMAKSRKTKDKFAALLRDLSDMGPLEKSPEPGYYFRKHFGDDYRENRKHVVKELGKVKKKYVDPIENQTYFVAVIETRSAYHTQISTSLSALKEWASTASAHGVDGTFRIQAFPSRTKARAAKAKFLRSRR